MICLFAIDVSGMLSRNALAGKSYSAVPSAGTCQWEIISVLVSAQIKQSVASSTRLSNNRTLATAPKSRPATNIVVIIRLFVNIKSVQFNCSSLQDEQPSAAILVFLQNPTWLQHSGQRILHPSLSTAPVLSGPVSTIPRL